jgi:hypothetical protein
MCFLEDILLYSTLEKERRQIEFGVSARGLEHGVGGGTQNGTVVEAGGRSKLLLFSLNGLARRLLPCGRALPIERDAKDEVGRETSDGGRGQFCRVGDGDAGGDGSGDVAGLDAAADGVLCDAAHGEDDSGESWRGGVGAGHEAAGAGVRRAAIKTERGRTNGRGFSRESNPGDDRFRIAI